MNAVGQTIILGFHETQRADSLTELDEFPQYLTLLFEIDTLVLNDDRHLNNIAVIAKDSKFAYCPIFDQGAGFDTLVLVSF